MVSLYDTLKGSYETLADAKKRLLKHDFVLVKDLSTPENKVFYNPKSKKLLMTVAGTKSIEDVGTDIYLALGKLKDTNRYKSAKATLENARKAFPNAKEVNVVGHSLGGAIASGIGKKSDKITTYNKGATIGQKTRPNERSIRTSGDIVSILANKSKTLPRQTKNLRGHPSVQNPSVPTFFKSHNLENLKYSNIYLGDSFHHKTEPEIINHQAEPETRRLRGFHHNEPAFSQPPIIPNEELVVRHSGLRGSI